MTTSGFAGEERDHQLERSRWRARESSGPRRRSRRGSRQDLRARQADDLAADAPRARQARSIPRRRWDRPRRRARRDLRSPRSERRREDDDHEDARHAARSRRAAPSAFSASIRSKAPREVRARLGAMLSGERSLYWKLTGRENLEYFAALYHVPPHETKTRIANVLAAVKLADRADDYVERYSTGMRQRLALARALLPTRRSSSSTSRPWASIRSPRAICAIAFASSRRRDARSSHDALHGRGRSALRPRRDHRSRPHRRARYAGGAEADDPRRRGRASRDRSRWRRRGRHRSAWRERDVARTRATERHAQRDRALRVRAGFRPRGVRCRAVDRGDDPSRRGRPRTLEDVFLALTGRALRE